MPDTLKIKCLCNKKWMLIGAIVLVLVALYYTFTSIVLYSNDAYTHLEVIPISPAVTGTLDKVYVKNNQKVSKGTLLFAIKPTPFALALSKAKAQMAQTQQVIAATQAKIKRLDQELANADKQNKVWKDTLDRYNKLTSKGYIAAQVFSNKAISYDQFVQTRIKILQAITSTKHEIRVYSALLKEQKSIAALAAYHLSQTKIYAPESGYINNLYVYKGQQLQANQPLFGLVRDEDLQVIANYKEGATAKVQTGKTVWIWLSSNPWHILKGTVTGIGRAVSREAAQGNTAKPYISPTTDWIRYAYRFPITIKLDHPTGTPMISGADATTLIFV